MMQPRLLVVSPHLDDAVLSVGAIVARSRRTVVVTMLAGSPRDARLTPWDGAAGFASSDEAMRARRDEDMNALRVLRATVCHLHYLDDQYGGAESVDQLAAALIDVVHENRPSRVLAPLGLFHRDHIRVADACLHASTQLTGSRWFLYDDVPYGNTPQLTGARLRTLRGRFTPLGPVRIIPLGAQRWQKRRALTMYRSQLAPLQRVSHGGRRSFYMAERIRAVVAR